MQGCSKILKLFVILTTVAAVLAALSSLFLVNLRDNGVTDFLEPLEVLLHVVLLSVFVGSHPVLLGLEGILNCLLVSFLKFILELLLVLNGVSHLVDVVLKLVLGFELFLDGLVLFGELLGLFYHAVNICFAETTLIVGNSDGLDLTCSLLGSLDSQDRVLINLESDLDLGSSTGSGRDAVDIELTELMVVLYKGAFTFEDGNSNGSLLVLVGGESLRLFGGDHGSTVNNLGQDSSDGLNTEGKGSHIDEEDILGLISGLSSQNTSLHGGTVSDSFVGVNSSVGFFTVEEILHELLDLGDTGGSTNKYDFVDFRLLHGGVIKNLLDRGDSLLEKIGTKLFESGSSESLLKINSVNKSFNRDLDLNDSREVTLGLLNFHLQLLEGSSVLLDVNVVLLLEDLDKMLSDSLVEIFSSEMGISSSGDDFENSIIDSKEGHIESTTSEIEDNNVLFSIFLVHTVGNSSGSGLVNNTENFHSGDSSSILGSLSLSIVEVSRDSDDSVMNFLTKVSLSNLLHLHEDHGRDFFRRESLLANSGHLNADVRLSLLGNNIVREPL